MIKIDDDLIEIISIDCDRTGDNYTIEYADAYGEQDTTVIAHDAYVDLYVYVEEE
jgi:hypothetical protein